MSVRTGEGLAAALLRRPVTPLRLRKFVRLARLVSPAVLTQALAALPDAAVRAQVTEALRAADVAA